MQLRARQLRRAMTPAETKLWQQLRLRQLGVQFRRQHAVGSFIVDFFCAKVRLIIEVDEDSHGDPAQAEYDAERTRWLQEQKQYRVIRFWNDDVLHNVEAVLARIVEALEPPPRPSPVHKQREQGRELGISLHPQATGTGDGTPRVSLLCPRLLRTGEGGNKPHSHLDDGSSQ